jgi:type II secretory pathway pseudopilin PulG
MTLLEVMIAVTLASILLVAATGLLVRLQQWDHRVRESSVRVDQSVRLVEAIRSDIQRATNVAVTSNNVLTVSGKEKHETRYTLNGDLCRREVIIGRATSVVETFTIGPCSEWKVDAGAPGRRSAYAISIERPTAEKPASHSLPFFVYAVQGKELVK